ncbi:MAG: GDYXXLXY domain-containing protein [Elusimicrobiales bacterium]|nr:GDYXXLXY domain-containing protein [Elusimicrobiales bacterium]
MKKLRITLGLQLLVFAAWGGWLLSSRSTASPEFYLETVPVDPRDLLSGTFVALTYKISAPEPCRRLLGARSFAQLYVKLEEGLLAAPTPAGPVKLYEATDCAERPGDGQWAKAGVQGGTGGAPRANYGIERFFLNENDPRKNARSGSVVAKVKLGRRNTLVLLDLVEKL